MSSESWLSRKFHSINRHSGPPSPNNDVKSDLSQGVKSIAHSIANSVRSRAHSPLPVPIHEKGHSESSFAISSTSRDNRHAVHQPYEALPASENGLSETLFAASLKDGNDVEVPLLEGTSASEPNIRPSQSSPRPRPKHAEHVRVTSRTTSLSSVSKPAYNTNNDNVISLHNTIEVPQIPQRYHEIATNNSSTELCPNSANSVTDFNNTSIPIGKPSALFDLCLPSSRATPEPSYSKAAPPTIGRKQSILPTTQGRLIRTLPENDSVTSAFTPLPGTYHSEFNRLSTLTVNMVRKIWVKRPSASATLVTIKEDDLVDDVRDMILKKYANSLGRNFDSPDVTLRICPRENLRQERQLGPEEHMCQTIDAYYPGGQTVDEALVIDVPLRRTPKPSPRGPSAYYSDDLRPMEAGGDYFPPMPILAHSPAPHLAPSLPVNGGAHHPALAQHAISVLTTGQVPPLPSPGSMRRGYTTQATRPTPRRIHTSSPTTANNVSANGMQLNPPQNIRSRAHSNASEKSNSANSPAPPPLPTPPIPEVRAATPPPIRSSSPSLKKLKKTPRNKADHPSLPAGVLNGAVPPINVLIVEDNIINLKLLEAFMKRLKVRWQTAMDGRQAVNKWRAGGFHLVLMDIQLPVMSGLEATREIRRLEKLNNIGVFSSSASSSAPEQEAHPEEEDKLPTDAIFKSPVIIVALTASSLQSDRHEALAAGCNDFLTKVCYLPYLNMRVELIKS